MKNLKKIALALTMALAFIGIGAQQAQAGSPLRFGIKAGMAVSSLKFNQDLLSSSNREGFTGGLNLQFSAPVINIGVDASLMYTHRQNRVYENGENGMTFNSDYIEVPIYFRWNIGLPIVNNVVTPFLATGPDFSFLVSNKNMKSALTNKTFDFAWNFGLGLRFFNHLELAASYGLGISNAASGSGSLYYDNTADGKNRFWTVTACWLF